ncbi:MAG: PilZ domain-containing protein [Leptospiraceae bacterium]|nr:PilZ domain-containing protein [Leptospiraceae bacterium]
MSSSFFNDSLHMRDSNQQKRKQARANARIEATFLLDGQNQEHSCSVSDLGTGGMSILSKSTLYMGDKIRVQLKVATRMLDISCEVVRVSGKSVGLRFVEISPENLERIQEFIHSSFFSPEQKKR